MWIVIHGNPVDGFGYIGPFDSFEAAHEHATNDGDIDDYEWWITQLASPETKS